MKYRNGFRLFPGIFFFCLPVLAQTEPLPCDEGATGLAFSLRKLPVTASLLHITAHPDDEDNPLLVLLNRGRGLRTGLLTLTRGDGGQNEIGPELFEALGIIRTGELMSMHRYDGAEQFFTRAYEFGYSYSVEETLEKWGREEILRDIVRVIRTFRPDVILTLPRFGSGGGQHHQASAQLAAEAFRAAADPGRFPEQLVEGLRPWQAKKIYERHRWSAVPAAEDAPDTRPAVQMETGLFDPLFGKTYYEVGMEARSLHRCQGMSQLIPLPSSHASEWKLVESDIPVREDESDLFEGIETGLTAIAGYAAGDEGESERLRQALQSLQHRIDQAFSAFDAQDPARSAPALAEGLEAVRRLVSEVRTGLAEESKSQVLFLLGQKEHDFEQALAASHMLTLDALSDDGKVVPGQSFEIQINVANGGSAALENVRWEVSSPGGLGFEVALESAPDQLEPHSATTVRCQVTVPLNTELTRPYWVRDQGAEDRYRILKPDQVTRPWGPPPLQVTISYQSAAAVRAHVSRPVQFRYEGPWAGGEQRHELMVVPRVSVGVSSAVGILPLEQAPQGRELRVQVLFNGQQPAQGKIRLRLPEGWVSEPPDQDIAFEREGQSITRRFQVRPPTGISAGNSTIQAEVLMDGQLFQEGFQVIDYHHIEQRLLYQPAEVEMKMLDVRVSPGVRLGYIRGVADEIPDALRQLGIDFDFLEEDDLAFGDLEQYDVIMTGVRAYLNREDLKAHNDRLLKWTQNGGVMIVHYNKYEFNSVQTGPDGRRQMGPSPYAPYPAQIGYGRVTDENAPARVLVPGHPVFNSPNPIGAGDWQGWVQERGLYFMGDKSEEYQDLISSEDPFEYNAGEKRGALIEAEYGQGRWLYVGLGLWRQLPAGVPGAYRLLANLVSLGGERSRKIENGE